MRNKKNKKIRIAATVIIAGSLCIGGFFGIKKLNNYLKDPALTNVSSNMLSQTDEQKLMDEMKQKRYISEVAYTEPFFAPEVYDVRFQRTSKYTPNKDISDEQLKESLCNTASGFFDALLNKGYHEVSESADKFRTGVMDYVGDNSTVELNGVYPFEDCDKYYESDNDEEVGGAYLSEKLAEVVGDYLVTTQTEQDVEFITNKSLVYKDCNSYYVRGILHTSVKSGNDDVFPSGSDNYYMLDVECHLDNSKKTGYVVSGVYWSQKNTGEIAEIKVSGGDTASDDSANITFTDVSESNTVSEN